MYEWLLVAKTEQKASLETIKCLKKNTTATGQPSPAQLVNLSLHPAQFQRNFASAQEKEMVITWKFWGVLHSQKLTVRPWKKTIPKGNDRIPTIHFRVGAVCFREGIFHTSLPVWFHSVFFVWIPIKSVLADSLHRGILPHGKTSLRLSQSTAGNPKKNNGWKPNKNGWFGSDVSPFPTKLDGIFKFILVSFR